ncbi:MAG: EAL domain-containing protein [Lachnospiraceae bacterium]|nr:EAL domain-containing protein [Lachnospiraceae bacterium]
MTIVFDLIGIAILLILLVYFTNKRGAMLPSYGVYYFLLIAMLAVGLLDILTGSLRMNGEVSAPVLAMAANILNQFLQIFLASGFSAYLICVSSIDMRISRHWMMLIYLPVLLGLVTIIFFAGRGLAIGELPWSFRAHPVLVTVLVIYVAFEFFISTGICVHHRKTLGQKNMVRLIMMAMYADAVLIVQLLYHDKLILVFFTALLFVDILLVIQKPEEVLDSSNALKRKYIYDAVEQQFRRGKPFLMVFIRILDYNVLQDSLGVEDTEQFMRQITAYLFTVRFNTLVIRLDQDMIAVRIPIKDPHDSENLFREIRERFSEPWHSGLLESMLSVGYLRAEFPREVPNMESFHRVLGNLNMAKMQPGEEFPIAKLLGDDREKKMLAAIRRGLEEGNFEVYYQPIYSTHDKRVVAAEALIRLIDPEMGTLPTEPMIALAEREGYILQIGEFVFNEVCRFYSECKLNEIGIEYIEVNLSAVQVMQNRLAEEFLEVMKKYGLGPERINFEITESSAINANAAVSRNIEHFESNGVSLSLDDYGTGYSNISYLYNVPFLIMKIDKSILWGSEGNKKADIILRNTFRMAQRLKMKVVMEGVETEAQIRKLLTLNCDYFQGFYFSKPVNGKLFIEYVKNFSLPEVCR